MDSEYNQLQHFISASPWNATPVMEDVCNDVSLLFRDNDLAGFMVDESGMEKKGSHSVGVARQYCGNLGKVCNCQVAVYGCLVSQGYGSLVDTRLFLPEEWTKDKKRCDKAGIPQAHQKFKKKTGLALEMIKARRAAGTRMDWVGADAFYGHDSEFLAAPDEMKQLFVIDIHASQCIYTTRPNIGVPAAQEHKRGKKPVRLKTDIAGIKAEQYRLTLSEAGWQEVIIRDSTKGLLKAQVHAGEVYTWNKEDKEAVKRLLIILKWINKSGEEEVKYAFSNASAGQFSHEQLAYMLSQRFWIENGFREVKQEIGMSDYQVRGWLAWHHHMALCMMAQYFILSEKILSQQAVPLLSAYDIRMLLIQQLKSKQDEEDEVLRQMQRRHQQRHSDYLYHKKKNSS